MLFALVYTWFVVVCAAVIEVFCEFGFYSGIYTSIYSLGSCILNYWQEDLHDGHLLVCMYEGAVIAS